MKNTAFSLMTALLAVMNESEPKDPYYVLAQYFLYHFDQLRDLNIYDVADACYVSRSGIRRFCQSIGFDNFSDLKAEADEWKRQCNYFIGYSVRPDYKEHLSGSIGEMMEEINRIATPAVLDKLAESIHASRHVVLFTSDFSGMAARSFQQSMVGHGQAGADRVRCPLYAGLSESADTGGPAHYSFSHRQLCHPDGANGAEGCSL